jgi:hypothetical protein
MRDYELWAEFAPLILDAAYEATLVAAVQNEQATGNNKVYLTLLGDGAFGSPDEWIMDAIRNGLLTYRDADLKVMIVSYSRSKAQVMTLVQKINYAS